MAAIMVNIPIKSIVRRISSIVNTSAIVAENETDSEDTIDTQAEAAVVAAAAVVEVEVVIVCHKTDSVTEKDKKTTKNSFNHIDISISH